MWDQQIPKSVTRDDRVSRYGGSLTRQTLPILTRHRLCPRSGRNRGSPSGGSSGVMGVAQDHDYPAGGAEELGLVVFASTCSSEVEETLQRAVAMLHSFWFNESLRTFEEVAAADPVCAMAHWRIAMTEMGNPMARVLPSTDALRTGLEASGAGRRASEKSVTSRADVRRSRRRRPSPIYSSRCYGHGRGARLDAVRSLGRRLRSRFSSAAIVWVRDVAMGLVLENRE